MTERVKNYNNGYIIDKIDSQYALNFILKTVRSSNS
jgi:hypothetical protein